MSEPNRPVKLYPPDLLPTAEMTKVFDPHRVRPWQHAPPPMPMPAPVPAPQVVVQSVPVPIPVRPVPAAAAAEVAKPHHAHVPGFTGMGRTQAVVTPLRNDQVDGILTMIRSRPAHHPHRPTSVGRVGSLMSGLFGTVRQADVTLRWLSDQRVTMAELLTTPGLRISITDLVSAGIVQTLGDLLALDFKSTDLTLRRDCFNCSHFVQLFGGSYQVLAQNVLCGGFTLQTLLEARPSFTCDDLQTLGVRAQHLVLDDDGRAIPGFDYKLLGMLGLGPTDWAELGLESDHILAYGITADAARRKLLWDPNEMAQAFGMPARWLERQFSV